MRKSLKKIKNKSEISKQRRRLAIRKKVMGTSDAPRVCVNRSNKHINVQLIDDDNGKTLFCAKTYGKKNLVVNAKANIQGAKLVGNFIGDKLSELKLNKAVFDRNGYRYTGLVKTLVDGIREKGIRI